MFGKHYQIEDLQQRVKRIEEYIETKDRGAFKRHLSSNQKLLILEYLGVIDYLKSLSEKKISNEAIGVLLEAITGSGADNIGKNINHVKLSVPSCPQKTRENVTIARDIFRQTKLINQLQLAENDLIELNKRNM